MEIRYNRKQIQEIYDKLCLVGDKLKVKVQEQKKIVNEKLLQKPITRVQFKDVLLFWTKEVFKEKVYSLERPVVSLNFKIDSNWINIQNDMCDWRLLEDFYQDVTKSKKEFQELLTTDFEHITLDSNLWLYRGVTQASTFEE